MGGEAPWLVQLLDQFESNSPAPQFAELLVKQYMQRAVVGQFEGAASICSGEHNEAAASPGGGPAIACRASLVIGIGGGMALCRGVNLVSESSPQVVKTTVAHMPPLLEHLSLPRCDLGVRTGVEGAGGSVTNQGCKL